MKWNEFNTNIKEYLRIVREDQRLFDVTLVTNDGQHIKAHKIILSAGSHFFSDIFLKSNHTNMLIYLKGINSVQLEHILDFLYNGEASVGQEELKEFLVTGEELQVKGFEVYVAGEPEELNRYKNWNLEVYENEKSNSEEVIDSDLLNIDMDNSYSSEGDLKENDEGKNPMNETSELDLQINQMMEKSEKIRSIPRLEIMIVVRWLSQTGLKFEPPI